MRVHCILPFKIYTSSITGSTTLRMQAVAPLLLLQQNKRRMWVHPLNEQREEQGDNNHLFKELKLVDIPFQQVRLTKEIIKGY